MASQNVFRAPLRWGGLFVAAAMLGSIARGDTLQPTEQLDHIILGVSNLDRGISEFEALTGVRPIPGGVHPRGTQNALVSLGSGLYVEIMAPVGDAQPEPPFELLPTLDHITPIGWVVSSQDMGRTTETLAARGVTTSQPIPGSRKRPDGRVLNWSIVRIEAPLETGVPRLIEWSDDSVHPSEDSPTGCRLVSFEVAGSRAVLDPIVDAFALGVAVVQADSPSLRLSLDCRGGIVSIPKSSSDAK
jgi:hypothetical protein